jgi:hypothetical protein
MGEVAVSLVCNHGTDGGDVLGLRAHFVSEVGHGLEALVQFVLAGLWVGVVWSDGDVGE